MGLSIHYSGTIKDISLVPDLVGEVAYQCLEFDWEYDLLNLPNTDSLQGIVFTPKNCETMSLTFLPSGQMCSPFNMMVKEIYDEPPGEPDMIYTTSVKTQYAGAEVHIRIIDLVRRLKEKYFSTFKMNDEAEYWDKNDKEALRDRFGETESAKKIIAEAIAKYKESRNFPES